MAQRSQHAAGKRDSWDRTQRERERERTPRESSQSPDSDALGCWGNFGGNSRKSKRRSSRREERAGSRSDRACREDPLTLSDMRDLLEQLKVQIREEVVSDLRNDVQRLAQVVQGNDHGHGLKLNWVADELKGLRSEVRALTAKPAKSTCAGGLCRIFGGGKGAKSSSKPSGPTVPEEPKASPVPLLVPPAQGAGAESVANERRNTAPSSMQHAAPSEAAVFEGRAAPRDHGLTSGAATSTSQQPDEQAATVQRAPTGVVRAQPPRPQGAQSGLLGPVVRQFEAAVVFGAPGEAAQVHREPFVSGVEAYAAILDKLGGNIGSYLTTNTKKLRRSKADRQEGSYREWLLTELHVHAATGYKEYLDDSAWMANLWIGRALEFFVEWFAFFADGQETKQASEGAYNETLRQHHNFVQRTAFSHAIKRLPSRKDLIVALQGDGDAAVVTQEVVEFVRFGRSLVRFCLETNNELDKRLQLERKRNSRRSK